MDGTIADPSRADRSGLAAAAGDGTLRLDFAGFSGPLDHLLTLARAHAIDLAQLSLSPLLDQLTVALQNASPAISLSQKADWVVMTAWLLHLRSSLMLPADAPARQTAAAKAADLRGQLIDLQAMQALAGWLDRQSQLGRDVFSRGQPEDAATVIGGQRQVDVVAFLWASLVLFDDADDAVDTTNVYRPNPPALYSVPEARARILFLLDDAPAGRSLAALLPAPAPENLVQRRSAWTSTFAAGLELARQGAIALEQDSVDASVIMRLQRDADPATAA